MPFCTSTMSHSLIYPWSGHSQRVQNQNQPKTIILNAFWKVTNGDQGLSLNWWTSSSIWTLVLAWTPMTPLLNPPMTSQHFLWIRLPRFSRTLQLSVPPPFPVTDPFTECLAKSFFTSPPTPPQQASPWVHHAFLHRVMIPYLLTLHIHPIHLSLTLPLSPTLLLKLEWSQPNLRNIN